MKAIMTACAKSISIQFILFSLLLFTTSSCMTTKTAVGPFKEHHGKTYTYAKGKQVWIFWGLIPLGRTNVNTPSSGSCEVVTKFNFGDFLITGLTGGLISTYTIKVKARENVRDVSHK